LDKKEFLSLKHGDIILGTRVGTPNYSVANGMMLYVLGIGNEYNNLHIIARILKTNSKYENHAYNIDIGDTLKIYGYEDFKLIDINHKERDKYEHKLFLLDL
jgi:hypothetical protein